MSKIKRIFAMFVAIAMVLSITPSYALSKTSAKTKAEYLKTEKRAYQEFMKSIEKSEYGELLKFTNGITGTYSGEFDLELEIPEMKTRKYVVKENGTYKDRYEDGAIEAYVEGEKVASLEIVANDNLVSVRVPELYEKYLTVDMSDLAGLVNKFVENEEDATSIIETLPTDMVYASDLMEYLKFTKAEEKILKNAGKKYAKLLDAEFLKNDNFIKENDETLTINNKPYKCSVVSYEISVRQLIDGFENIWKEFKNDTALVNLIWGKTEGLYNKMKEVNMVTEELPTKEQVLGAVDYLLSELKTNITLYEDMVISSTLYHQNGKLLRREISKKSTQNNEEFVFFNIYTVKDKYYAFCTEDVKLEDFVTTTSKETIHNVVMTSKDIEWEEVKKEVQTPFYYYDLETQETKVEYTTEYDYEWVSKEVENVDKATVKITKVNNNQCNFEITVEGSDVKVLLECIKNKGTSKEYDVNVNVDVISGEQSFGLNARLAYKKDIKLNKVNAKGNEINLNEKSKEELTTLFEENKDKVIEKAQGKFLSAFYYEELIKPLIDNAKNTFDDNYEALTGTNEFINDLTYYN